MSLIARMTPILFTLISALPQGDKLKLAEWLAKQIAHECERRECGKCHDCAKPK